jgi:NTP pyrophosphatase (non-canonical NTP hydrolase)
MLLTEELGELCKAVRKNATDTKCATDSKHHNIDEEIADVFYYLVDICNKLNIDLEKSFLEKEVVNEQRTWKNEV